MTYTAPERDFPLLFTVSSIDGLGAFDSSSTPSSTAWPLANLALFVPFSVPIPCQALEGWAGCGTTATGNFDIGIYDAAGNRLTSSGATAKAASGVKNTTTMTDYTLSPDVQYYMAIASDGTINYIANTALQEICEAAGVLEATTAYVLPNPVTYALTTRAYLPYFGLNLLGTAL